MRSPVEESIRIRKTTVRYLRNYEDLSIHKCIVYRYITFWAISSFSDPSHIPQDTYYFQWKVKTLLYWKEIIPLNELAPFCTLFYLSNYHLPEKIHTQYITKKIITNKYQGLPLLIKLKRNIKIFRLYNTQCSPNAVRNNYPWERKDYKALFHFIYLLFSLSIATD